MGQRQAGRRRPGHRPRAGDRLPDPGPNRDPADDHQPRRFVVGQVVAPHRSRQQGHRDLEKGIEICACVKSSCQASDRKGAAAAGCPGHLAEGRKRCNLQESQLSTSRNLPRLRPLTGGRSTMRRVFIVSGCWFILWMTMGVMVSVLFRGVDGLFAGAMNGAWLAVLTSFAWPWIMPDSISRWMENKST